MDFRWSSSVLATKFNEYPRMIHFNFNPKKLGWRHGFNIPVMKNSLAVGLKGEAKAARGTCQHQGLLLAPVHRSLILILVFGKNLSLLRPYLILLALELGTQVVRRFLSFQLARHLLEAFLARIQRLHSFPRLEPSIRTGPRPSCFGATFH